jgi:phage shock protein E
MQTFVWIALGLVVLFFLLSRSRADLSGQEAKVLVDGGALLLDVRTSAEFDAGHIPGAKNISVAELPGRVDDVGARERTVVVYCRSGNRSARAKRILEKAGFGDVRDLGAMSRW